MFALCSKISYAKQFFTEMWSLLYSRGFSMNSKLYFKLLLTNSYCMVSEDLEYSTQDGLHV